MVRGCSLGPKGPRKNFSQPRPLIISHITSLPVCSSVNVISGSVAWQIAAKLVQDLKARPGAQVDLQVLFMYNFG